MPDHRIIYGTAWKKAETAALASRYGRTPAQIFFRYLTQTDVVPLTGTRSEAHMREDLAIFEFELADAERAGLDALFCDQRA